MKKAMSLIGCLLLVTACQKSGPPESAASVAVAAPPGASDCHLKVGWDPWEPYQYTDADGSMRGMDVDIVQSLARGAGCTLEFRQGNWSQMLTDVRSGKIDVLMAATPTEARRQYAAFSAPYRHESFVLLLRTADAQALAGQDLAALVKAGKRVGITEGYYYGEPTTRLMEAADTRAAFVSAPIVELNYQRLMTGEIDVLLDDPFVAASVMRRKGLKDQVTRSVIEIASDDVSFMYSKASVPADVVKRLDAALSTRQADGSLAKLISRYQGDLVAWSPETGGGAALGSAAMN